jgi:hypothetical protein
MIFYDENILGRDMRRRTEAYITSMAAPLL